MMSEHCDGRMTPKRYDVRCETCSREMDPNWVRNLRGVIGGAIDCAMNDMQRQHPVQFPNNWIPSFKKRFSGQLINKIWEIERGLCSIRKLLDD